jgi:hypothetical protein
MAKIIDNKGVEHEFEPIPYDEKYLGKVNLTVNGKEQEGIWIAMTPEDHALYHADNSGNKEFICSLANDALAFYPAPSWGLHILARMNGANRAVADVMWVDYTKKENRVWSPAVPEDKRL